VDVTYEQRFESLCALIANLRDVFPFEKSVDLAEIVHSPDWCIEAMIRSSHLINDLIEKSEAYINMLENCADGYYRVEESEQAKAYEKTLDAYAKTHCT
jgi:hypothetical protein